MVQNTRRFTLSRRQRRRTEIPVAIMTVMLCGLPWLAAWQLGVFLSAIWLIPVLCTVPQDLYGSTELTERGLQLRTPFRRRFVPWGEVTDVTARERDVKGGRYKDALVHRASGRPLRLPGLRAYERDGVEWSDFDVSLNIVRDYRRRAEAR